MSRGAKKKAKKLVRSSRRPREFGENVSPADSLDVLLRDRYHGAANIRGIRFQLRYSLFRAIELAIAARKSGANAEHVLYFEGLEDVDIESGPSISGLKTATVTGREFVQVKTASKPWGWHKLGDPLVGFIEILRTGVDGTSFQLIFNFHLRGDLEKLSRFSELKPGEQNEIRTKLRKLCRKIGGTDLDADRLLDRLVIQQVTEKELRTRVRLGLADLTGVADTEAIDAYELMFAGRALKWAADRDRITGRDVNELTLKLRDGLARSEHFTAVTCRIVGTLALAPDARPEDFFEGKRVRIGHIVDGLDVRRPDWLRRIEEAFTSAPVVVIRAPSGHGKSTLAYRYAFEKWPKSEVIVVRSVQSEEEVGAIEDYFRFRSELGLPIRVLIDVDYRTRLWCRVAAAASALGGQTLVTVRVEDWSRFAVDALTRHEIIEPTMDFGEAEHIYAAFLERKCIHPSVDSAAWAFERLRPPHLLLEFVYLLTHGQMLKDLLRDQVREFKRVGDDPKKVEVLRIATLANALGASVSVDALLREIPLRDDPQEVVGSLLGEYLILEDGMLGPVHWVRSEHMARILHEAGVPSVTTTALTAASLIPIHALRFLVANAFNWEGIDQEVFLQGLIERFRAATTEAILAITSGLFEAGERAYFEANREIFDQAHVIAGPGCLHLIESEVAPIMRVNVLARMLEILGEKAGHIPALIDLVNRIQAVPRGLDFAGRLLREVGSYRSVSDLSIEPGAELGKFLDWCALTDVSLPAWKQARDHIIEAPVFPGKTVEDVAALAPGLFRFDRKAFDAWFARHEDDILPMLQLATRSLSFRLIRPSRLLEDGLGLGSAADCEGEDTDTESSEKTRRDEVQRAQEDAVRFGPPVADVEFFFVVEHEEGSSKPHEQAIERLELLRRALPFVGRYCSRGEYMLPEGLEPPVDDTIKNIPRWNLALPSDVEKNVVWRFVVTKPYLPDTTYHLQEAWYRIRSLTLRFIQAHVSVLLRTFRNQSPRVEEAFGKEMEVYTAFETASKYLPRFSEKEIEWIDPNLVTALGPLLKKAAPNDWITCVENFSRQFWEYILEQEERMGHLMLHNCSEAAKSLAEMHAFFKALFHEAPDYFGARALDQRESALSDELALLVEGVVDPLGWRASDPMRELRQRAERRATERLGRIQRVVSTAADQVGISLVPPNGITREGGLTSVPIGFEIANQTLPSTDLLDVVAALSPVAELVDRIWMIPLRGGARLGENGYGIGTGLLKEDGSTWFDEKISLWQLLFAVPVPQEVLACFPQFDVVSTPEPKFSERLIGLRAVAETYARWRCAIEAITEERNHPLLRELAHSERGRLADLEQEMLQQTDTLERELIEIDTSKPGIEKPSAAAIVDARDFLDRVRVLPTLTEVSSAPQIPNIEEIQRILERLGAIL